MTTTTEAHHELASGRIVTVEAEQTRNGVHIMRGMYCTQKHAKCIAGQCGHQKTRVYLTEGNPDTDSLEMTSVTTFLQIIDKPGLKYWYGDQMLDKVRETLVEAGNEYPDDWVFWVNEIISAARSRPDAVRDEAADWGTQAHGIIEKIIRAEVAGEGLKGFSYDEKFIPTVKAFEDFTAEYGLTYLHSEIMLYHPLGMAGSADFIAKNREGKIIVGDWKTGARLYPEAALQGSAYAFMYEEETGESVDSIAIIKLSKDKPGEGESGFKVSFVANWGERFSIFLSAMDLSKGLKLSPWKED